MTELDLKQIREDAERATQGEWKFCPETHGFCSETGPWGEPAEVSCNNHCFTPWLGDEKIDANARHIVNTQPQNTLALLDRLEKAERKLEETTIELGKVCWESTAKINERDAQLENTESLIAQLTEEIAYGNKVITEKDAQLEKSYVDRNALTRKQARIEELEAQLKVCVEALRDAVDWSGQIESDVISMREFSAWNDWMKKATEALEKVGVL